MKQKSEIQKCKESISYFAEKYGIIKTPKGTRKFNKRELELLKRIEETRNFFELKLRNHYK